jgi:hypothetical protein
MKGMIHMTDLYAPYRTKRPWQPELLPQPIFEENPRLVDLYWRAWESAWSHVLERTDTPQPFYMDEAMNPGTIWIWDTCFMSMFCRYAPHVFPGIESLNNFYFILYDHKPAPVRIHFADNPPLFAWVEWQYFQLTGNLNRLRWVLVENRYLEQHFEFMEHARRILPPPHVNVRPIAKRLPLGFRWRGNTSGMDNTPRGRNCWNDSLLNPRKQIGYNNILWLDLLAQQALAADCIAKIAHVCDRPQIEQKYRNIAREYGDLLNTYYWDPVDGFYYDLHNKSPEKIKELTARGDPARFSKVKTVASYWPMVAGVCNTEQAKALAEKVRDENQFGGYTPWPSLSRDDEAFVPLGRYWRGGVWLPTAYMGTKALDNYGFWELADTTAERLVCRMDETYRNYSPHTIWEVYSPTESKPSTLKDNVSLVREDFCGWSALGPISLFIENILGIHEINAIDRKIRWRISHSKPHGIKNLRFGPITTDLMYNEKKIHIQSTEDYILELCNGQGVTIQTLSVKNGENSFSFSPEI